MSRESIHFKVINPITIETQQIEELAFITGRANAARDGEPLPEQAEIAQVDDLQRRLNKPNAWTELALYGKATVGFALGYPEEDQPNTEYLSMLMVDPDHWGKGAGIGLLDQLVDRARDAGRERITLKTRAADNERAQRLYTKYGFTVTGPLIESVWGDQEKYELPLGR